VINTPLLGRFDPRFLIFDMPFMFKDWSHVDKVLTSSIGADLMKSLEAKQIKAFNFLDRRLPHVLNYKKPVKTPEDLAGLKIRTLDNPVHVAIMNAMGANATPMQYRKSRPHCASTPSTASILPRRPPLPRSSTKPTSTFAHRPRLHRHLPDEHEALQRDAGRPAKDHGRRKPGRRGHRNGALQQVRRSIARRAGKRPRMQIDEVDREKFRARMKPVFDRYQDRVGKDLIDQVTKLGA